MSNSLHNQKKDKKGDCTLVKKVIYYWKAPIIQLRNMGVDRPEFVYTELVKKHVSDMAAMLKQHFSGSVNNSNSFFEIDLSSEVLWCEIENLIYSGSKFNYYGTHIEMTPVIYKHE